MKRTGYQLVYRDTVSHEWKHDSSVYLSRKAIEEYSDTFNCPTVILLVEVIEDDQSIDDFYNQVEKENPAYQQAIEEVIKEAITDIEAGNFKKVTDVRSWLKELSEEK